MKKIIVRLLLLIFFATQFGSILSDIGAPVIHAVCYRKTFKWLSASSGDRILVLDSTSFRRSLTDDREIRIAGELFDIISISRKGKNLHLKVSSDALETRLANIIQQIRDAVRKSSGRHQQGKQVQSWLFKLYCRDEGTSTDVIPEIISSTYNFAGIPKLQPGIHNRHLQPPDLFV